MKAKLPAIAIPYKDLVLQNVSEIIVITDVNFRVQSWNAVAEKFYGLPAAKAIGQPLHDLVQFTYVDTSAEEATKALHQNKIWTGKVSILNAEGERFFFQQTTKYITVGDGQEPVIMMIGCDITARQQAEDKLVQSELFYRTLIANSLDLTLLLNENGEITFVTPAITRILGYDETEVLQTNAFQYIHPEDLGWALQSFEREVEENPEIKFILVRILKKDGEWLWCMARGHNLLHHPSIRSIAVYIHDDTPRRRASEALKESEKRFRNLIRDLQIGVLLQDANGSIEMTNSAMCKLFDISEEALLGGKIWEIFTNVTHEDGRQFLLDERPSFRACAAKVLVKDVVMGVWHPGRQERIWLMVGADPILDATGNVLNVVSSFMDITERKKLEKKSFAEKIAHQRQLAQATIDGQEKERLEMGKELHDNIGQQLTTIKLFLDLAKTTADEQTLNMVNMALRNVSEVINEVRSISRSLVPPSLRDLGFIDSVNDLIDSLRTTQSLQVDLDYYDFDEDLLPDNKKLTLYRIIQELLNNIIKHASASHVAIVLRFTGSTISLQMKDDGVGFEVEKVKRGLGITNIYNRAELIGGKVVLTSSPGKGCEVNVSLPHISAILTFG